MIHIICLHGWFHNVNVIKMSEYINMNKTIEQDMQDQDYETKMKDTLDHSYNNTKYQKLLIAFLCMNEVIGTFVAMINSFVFMNPIFNCQGQLKNEVDACADISKCFIVNDFTGAYYADLYCGNQGLRETVQSLYFLGIIAGLGVLTLINQRKGRRFALILALVLNIFGITFIFVGIWSKFVGLMMLGQVVSGIYYSSITICSYNITCEMCSDIFRQRAIMLYCASWGLAQVCFYFLYNFMPYWDCYLILLILLPCIGLLLISTFFLIESPHYSLFLAKDIKLFQECVRKLSIFNDIDEQSIVSIVSSASEYLRVDEKKGVKIEKSVKNQILDLVKHKKYLRYCICLSLISIGYNIFYYSMQNSMERTGYNFGVNMLFLGVNEFLGYLSASYFIDKVPRKKGLLFCIITGSALGLSFIFEDVSKNLILQSTFAILIRILSVYSYSILCLLETQLFPFEFQAITLGIEEIVSEVADLGVPYFVNFSNNISLHPIIFSGLFYLILGVIPTCLVEERKKPKQHLSLDEERGEQREQKDIQKIEC